MTSLSAHHFLVLDTMLFAIGIFGILINRGNLLLILMSIEVILLAVNLNLVAFSTFSGEIHGQIFALMVLAVASAETAVGLAILVNFFRNRGSIAVDDASALKG